MKKKVILIYKKQKLAVFAENSLSLFQIKGIINHNKETYIVDRHDAIDEETIHIILKLFKKKKQ